jgi:hypothetical protein
MKLHNELQIIVNKDTTFGIKPQITIKTLHLNLGRKMFKRNIKSLYSKLNALW